MTRPRPTRTAGSNMPRAVSGLTLLLCMAVAGACTGEADAPTRLSGWFRCAMQKAFFPAHEPGPVPADAVAIDALAETSPVQDPCDAADDPAIWVNPDAPERSLVVGTNKVRGLNVYRLDGSLLTSTPVGPTNNVDLRSDVVIGGTPRVVVAASNKNGHIDVLELDPETGRLTNLAAAKIDTRVEDETYGFCLYRSARSGALHAFVTDKSGAIEQWRLDEVKGGRLAGSFVRKLRVATPPAGCGADDANAQLFVGEEDRGVWRFGAEPEDRREGILIAPTGLGSVEGARLYADVEGLAIYAAPDAPPDAGYLVVSSQGNDSYVLFDRSPPHAYRGSFQIRAGERTVGDTDGLDVTAGYAGRDYPMGLLVVQDGTNRAPDGSEAHQNFKLVSWQDIADALSPDAVTKRAAASH